MNALWLTGHGLENPVLVKMLGFVSDQNLVQVKAICLMPGGILKPVRIQELFLNQEAINEAIIRSAGPKQGTDEETDTGSGPVTPGENGPAQEANGAVNGNSARNPGVVPEKPK